MLHVKHFYTDDKAQGEMGLLADQNEFTTAALDIYEATGDGTYKTAAQAAADYVLIILEDKEAGGFYDLAPDPNAIGELARPKKSGITLTPCLPSFDYLVSQKTPVTGKRRNGL